MKSIRPTPPLICGILLFSIMSPLGAVDKAEDLAVYTFGAGTLAAAPSKSDGTKNCEATDARWVVPGKEEPLFGFGAKVGTAYLKGAAAPRKFDPEVYLTFTVKAASGHAINFSSLSFRFGASTSADYEGSEFAVFVRVSSDAQVPAFSHELPIGSEKIGEAACNVSPVPSPEFLPAEGVVDLLTPEFQNRESVTFRIHLYCPERSSRVFLRLDDIVVHGTVTRK